MEQDKCIETYKEPSARTIVITMVLAFVIPVIILALAYVKIQVWPGSKFTVLVYDLNAQFSSIISSIRYIGRSDNSLFISYGGALANNAFLDNALYYLDPMMWVTVLFPLEELTDVLYYITLIKTGLCGVGASIYFLFGINRKKYPFVILIFSVCYALLSYNVMYGQCIRWLNVVALAPLILLGIDHMIKGKKGALYVVCMTLSLYYSTQLSYMTGLFSILYLIWRLSEKPSNIKKTIGRFVLCNIFCLGLYMPFFVPFLFNVLNGRMKTANSMAGTLFYSSLLDIIKQFVSCSYSPIESKGIPNLFCGSFIPLISLAYYFIPQKSVRNRLISACISGIFVLSLWIVPINQFWHGFSEPISFPARYSFLFCLFLLIQAYYVAGYVIEKHDMPGTVRILVYGVVAVITCTEMYLNAGYILSSLSYEMGYEMKDRYQWQIQYANDALEKIDDEDFYRIGRDLPYSLNDGMVFGYNGIGYFSSFFERNTMDFLGYMGYSERNSTVRDSGGTALTESLLGVKYKLLRAPELFGYYETKFKNKFYELQFNENALPLGFLIDYRKYDPAGDTDLVDGINDHNSFAFQESVISEMAGRRVRAYENVGYSIEEFEADGFVRAVRMRFTAKDERPVWIYCRKEYEGRIVTAPDRDILTEEPAEISEEQTDTDEEVLGGATLTVNGNPAYPFIDKLSTMCIYLGTFKPGEEVTVEAACVNMFDDPWIVYYNEDECKEALASIRDRGFKITEHGNGVIRGTVNIEDDDDLMIMTLPYMRGYKVKVDGKSAQYGAYRGALFALMMEPGEHTVEISFVPYGFIPGLIIGLLALLATVLYIRRSSKSHPTTS